MKIITTKRGGGKTTELIKLSAETGDIIVTQNVHTAHYTMEMARKMEMDFPRPITFEEFLGQHWRGRKIRGFLIDDVELLLMYMLQSVTPYAPIHALTISTGVVYEPGAAEAQ